MQKILSIALYIIEQFENNMFKIAEKLNTILIFDRINIVIKYFHVAIGLYYLITFFVKRYCQKTR